MSNLRTALEEALAANPDDLASHSAYADLLMEQGDPRGEFIQVQLALEDPSLTAERRAHLKRRELDLLANERQWLGGLAEHLIENEIEDYRRDHGLINRWTWRRGWLDEVGLWYTKLEAARALARAPEARLLTRLDLGEVSYQDDYLAEVEDGIPEGSEFPDLYPLRKAAFLKNLRYFRVGDETDLDGQYHNCRSCGEGLVELVAAMPRIEDLHVLSNRVNMEALFSLPSLTRLRTLVLYHERRTYPLPVLANNPALGRLRTIRLHPAHSFEDGYLPLDVVAPLLNSPHLPSLRHLHLHASTMGDAGCEEIVRSGILRRLETLDLRLGRVTDAGARVLASCPDIRHLQCLSLAFNQLSGEGCELLEALGLPTLKLDDQDAPGSDEYLMSGDME